MPLRSTDTSRFACDTGAQLQRIDKSGAGLCDADEKGKEEKEKKHENDKKGEERGGGKRKMVVMTS